MAGSKSAARMDYWRNYFQTSNGDIFETIEKAIIVAASDYPKEFRIRRDRIAQALFSCKLIKCSGCDKLELALPGDGEEHDDEDEDDDGLHQVSNYSYGVAEALTAEIEEETQMFGEVMRIKEIVENSPNESESVLYNSLRKLQLMALSVETLKATEIGKSVNTLRKHSSKAVSQIARTLIEYAIDHSARNVILPMRVLGAWKDMVDRWVIATEKTPVSEATPESMNPSVLDEEDGLPSPPLDDLGLFYPHTTSMVLSKFFDGMDEYGNPGNGGGFDKSHDDCRTRKLSWPKPSNEPARVPNKESCSTKPKKQPSVVKPTKPFVTESGPGRRIKPNPKRKLLTVSRDSGEPTAREKFEATKRKLQERYQQAENAKKQRTIQVMELHDLPKQQHGGLPVRNQNSRPGNRNR